MQIPVDVGIERQAFDAVLTIRNGLAHLDLEYVAVALNVTDESGAPVRCSGDPNDNGALFFARTNALSGIGDVSGRGRVAAGTTAEARWLIIPAPGAGATAAAGVPYRIGARLSYSIAGSRFDVDVLPDTIRVVPMPDLLLDLFLTECVPGDDPRTTDVEPSNRFPLGLRILNQGAGAARAVGLSLGRPRIIANATGLLIDFSVEGCDVNGVPQGTSFQATIGDVGPGLAAVARWYLRCPLAGTLSSVTVATTHADELGGRLTALIRDERTRSHSLRKDVRVDVPGRDAQVDFLTVDGRLYESDGMDGPCADISASAALAVAAPNAVLTVQAGTGGFVYAACAVDAAVATGRRVASAVRSDGKSLPADNVWLDRRWSDATGWADYLCVFDHARAGAAAYTIALAAAANRPPVFLPVAVERACCGATLTFSVEASDPDGPAPRIAAAALPAGAVFDPGFAGRARVQWCPTPDQAGAYRLQFTASDGEDTTAVNVPLDVINPADAAGAVFLFH